MLPPELVRARKKGDKLTLVPLTAPEREQAHALARELIALTRSLAGETRETVEAAWAAVPVAPKQRKILLGLTHLIDARSEFEAPLDLEPERLREKVFVLAAAQRKELGEESRFDRGLVLAAVAEELGLSAETIDESLYADLRSAQRLRTCALPSPEALVEDYELSQVQSALLRAVKIVADVRAGAPDRYRELFRKLKFRQLLHRIEPLDGGGYRLLIDGPLSLFGATTKYGMELALALPALLECGSVHLGAELRWGKRREALRFELTSAARASAAEPTRLRDEVSDLLAAIEAEGPPWCAEVSERLIELPGGGVLVPDLELWQKPASPRGKPSGRILVEVLGFWSRDAVFRRIEAAEKGLSERVLFVVSSRLRVSEELLEDVPAASLYVYKGKINVASLLRKASELAAPAKPAKERARR